MIRTRARARGFTVIELMHVASILAIVAAASGALYLEARVSAEREESTVRFQRQASLISEWISRDARGALEIHSGAGGLELLMPDQRLIRYAIEGAVLTRDDGSGPMVLTRRAGSATIEHADDRAWIVRLTLERELLPGRSIRVVRRFFVARRT